MNIKTIVSIALAAAAAVGCHHDKKPATTPVAKPDQPPAKIEEVPIKQVTNDTPVSPNLALSGDLVQMCGIKPVPTAGANPTFDYDKDELTKDDRTVLDQLATCMTTGPLKGKAVSLIGRADPRGTEEYNLGLGSRRAHSVGTYLTRLGVGEPQLGVTTRGALDASGTDESGWKQDRRVDVQLRN
jgi:outer membrane protein OmpA-like peptidoglycan-associated protein